MCVPHSKYDAFLTLALPKCNQKPKQNTHFNTYSHIGIKNHENVSQIAQKGAPMDPGDPPL
jgi:hypothetical protein